MTFIQSSNLPDLIKQFASCHVIDVANRNHDGIPAVRYVLVSTSHPLSDVIIGYLTIKVPLRF